MLYPFCFYQKKIVKTKKVRLPLNELGFLRGMAIFDYLIFLQRKPIFLSDHLKRFLKNAKTVFGEDFKFKEKEIEKIIKKLIEKNKVKNGAIRLILSGGKTFDGKTYLGKPNFLVLIEKLFFPPKSFYEKGIKLITFEFERPFFEMKHTFYFPLLLSQKRLLKEKALEPLYVSKGKVLESATSNFFIFKDNALITPKERIFQGITRKKIIKLAKKFFKVKEREIKLSEVFEAEEAFITATGKGVLPVIKIDQKTIGKGKPGKVTKTLMKLYFELLEKEVEKN